MVTRIRKIQHEPPATYLSVHVDMQVLAHVRDLRVVREYTISTSAFGVGNASGSNQTPPGLHRIAQKIGDGAPLYAIFRSRENTGVLWQPGLIEENLILTRIMWLAGLEEGVNCGANIDSHDRYIYIHGTNREDLIGTPLSHGCVVMRNADVIELFDAVEEGTLVVIDH
jgi:hypothetical protein